MNYDAKDYAANPGKYSLFCTARVAKHIFTENGENDLAVGAHVGVKFFRSAWNALYRRNEPVYEITHNGTFWGHLYAGALADFVL